METGEKANQGLKQKMRVLEKIAENTETQSQFIQARKMTGLKRLLRERAVLLDELAVINEKLARQKEAGALSEAAVREIAAKGQELVERSRQVVRQAIAERARIAAELRSSKARRQVKNQYDVSWTAIARRSRINKKG